MRLRCATFALFARASCASARGGGSSRSAPTARERCRALPTGVAREAIAGGGAAPPLLFFSGDIPTDAGGVGDVSSWGVLAAFDGCAWTKVDAAWTAARIERRRAPDGRRLLVQTNVVGQCTARTRFVSVRGARAEVVFEAQHDRDHMGGVCDEARRLETVDAPDGSLAGLRVLSRDDAGAWRAVEERRWRGNAYAVVPIE